MVKTKKGKMILAGLTIVIIGMLCFFSMGSSDPFSDFSDDMTYSDIVKEYRKDISDKSARYVRIPKYEIFGNIKSTAKIDFKDNYLDEVGYDIIYSDQENIEQKSDDLRRTWYDETISKINNYYNDKFGEKMPEQYRYTIQVLGYRNYTVHLTYWFTEWIDDKGRIIVLKEFDRDDSRDKFELHYFYTISAYDDFMKGMIKED